MVNKEICVEEEQLLSQHGIHLENLMIITAQTSFWKVPIICLMHLLSTTISAGSLFLIHCALVVASFEKERETQKLTFPVQNSQSTSCNHWAQKQLFLWTHRQYGFVPHTGFSRSTFIWQNKRFFHLMSKSNQSVKTNPIETTVQYALIVQTVCREYLPPGFENLSVGSERPCRSHSGNMRGLLADSARLLCSRSDTLRSNQSDNKWV